MEVLTRAEWEPLARAHGERVDRFTAPHLARRESRVKHPVHDFLFTYYAWRPAQLRRWHPGLGVGLEDAAEHTSWKGYAAGPPVAVDPAYVASQRPLVATASRPAQLGCFGLHEWAMVHRAAEHEGTRHDWPLRLGQAGTDEVVESHRITCTHFDAYRFFTPSARPLNTLSPTSRDREAFEQPGCLHAGMDLYKHAFRLSPMVPSDLVADCFELAWDIRTWDMRAAPYDLADLGLEPVRIETAEGKREYAAAQSGFAERGAPLRARLVEVCDRILAASAQVGAAAAD